MLDQAKVLKSDIERKPLIAVTMATSRQGVSVVNELSKTNKYQIRAITRNTMNAKAIELESLNNVEVVKGDLMDPKSPNKAFNEVNIIFGNTTPTTGWKILEEVLLEAMK